MTMKTPPHLFAKGHRYEDERTATGCYDPNRGAQAFATLNAACVRAGYRYKEARLKLASAKDERSQNYWRTVVYGARAEICALTQLRRDFRRAKIGRMHAGVEVDVIKTIAGIDGEATKVLRLWLEQELVYEVEAKS